MFSKEFLSIFFWAFCKIFLSIWKVYLEPSKTTKFELYVKTAYDFQALTVLTKSSILEVWLGTEYAPPAPSLIF